MKLREKDVVSTTEGTPGRQHLRCVTLRFVVKVCSQHGDPPLPMVGPASIEVHRDITMKEKIITFEAAYNCNTGDNDSKAQQNPQTI